jgi:hypothetical protein
MKRLVVAAILIAFVSPAPFCLARDANSDVLRLEAKANQTQHQKDAARLKAIEDEAAGSATGRAGQVTQVPHM